MRTEIVHDMVERNAQVFHQRHLRAGFVVERHHLVENAEVASFLYICNCSEYKPHRIIVETASDVVVSTLCKRLVLMIAAAVRELGRSYVYDTLTRPFRYLVYKSHKVLVGVAEAHSAADSALEERSGTGHVESHHALVLVPYVHHPVELLLRTLH